MVLPVASLSALLDHSMVRSRPDFVTRRFTKPVLLVPARSCEKASPVRGRSPSVTKVVDQSMPRNSSRW